MELVNRLMTFMILEFDKFTGYLCIMLIGNHFS